MRESGILMHITSLNGPYGIGTMGKHARAFVDFLAEAGQSWWQILPLSPTGYGNSPYQSCSAFAGNHYLIDPDELVEQGLLEQEEISGIMWSRREEAVDFGLLHGHRLAVLRLAYSRFTGGEEFDGFCRTHHSWLEDYALFMALKEKNGGDPWYHWQDAQKFRDPDTLSALRTFLADEIRFHCFVQFKFMEQWSALRAYAREKGVGIIGDVPIYVPLDCADVWSQPELFRLDAKLDPVAVAGCPPDAFSEDGQLWGNPLYRWDRMKRTGYDWWIRRMQMAQTLYDKVRLDHFRGFEAYWAIPYGHKTAKGGRWVKGPGMSFLRAVAKACPELSVIAEDLGFLTPQVLKMRDASGYPGMKVLQFAFDGDEPSAYLPHNHVPHSVCYIGTHDNMTCLQWLESAEENTVEFACRYMNLDPQDPVWGVIRTAFASVSDLCILQMQDLLELGAEGRMNFPGTLSDLNWTWRVKDGIITNSLALRIRELTEIYGRLGKHDATSR